MLSSKKIEELMGVLLIIGTLLSVVLVSFGGFLYLIEQGAELRTTALITASYFPKNFTQIISGVYHFSSLAIIDLGLLVLVGIQLLRVALLVIYYILTKDRYFILISLFILLILVYSLV